MIQDQEERDKGLKIIKASNEMLADAKKNVMKQSKLSDSRKREEIKKIDEAIRLNYLKAKNILQANEDEINSLSYNEVSEHEKQKYDEYLKKRGITDEQLHQKDIATANDGTVGQTEAIVKKRRRRRSKTDNDDMKIVRVANEEELMKKSMVSSEKELNKPISNREKEEIDFIEKNTSARKVKDSSEAQSSADIKQESDKRDIRDIGEYDFDFSTIPNNVQYDVIPLPSNGECYPHHIGRLPVAFLTASDENIIASPNMYRDGKVIDVILERKILDKRVKVSELCQGDRDAIILWLRATGYGSKFPIVATHPETGKKYNLDVDLATIKMNDFNLVGDNNGYFDYKTDSGDLIKFKYPSKTDEDKLRETLVSGKNRTTSYDIIRYTSFIRECVDSITSMNEEDRKDINDCINDIKDIVSENVENESVIIDNGYNDTITEQMKMYTMSINGNCDRGFVEQYIDNMRSFDAYKYRKYVNLNKPGMDFNITINVPQSDGGGSFKTFLTIDDTIFLNIQ